MFDTIWYVPHMVVLVIGAVFDAYEESKEVIPNTTPLSLVDIKLSKKRDFYNVKKKNPSAFPVSYAAYKE